MSKIVRLPGLVDVHVHLREPGGNQKEDFETGTKAAIAGGFTTILDMPNNPIPTVTKEGLDEKIKLATGRIYCDLGFHFGGSKIAVPDFKRVKDTAFALKVYMNHTTGNLLIESDKDLDEIFSNWPKTKVLIVHAEGDTLKKAIKLAKKYKNKLHIAHVGLATEVDLIKKAKKDGMNITCEVSSHHIFLTDKDAKKLGPFGVKKPPFSSKKDVDYIWKNLDVIDMFASDHAPHSKKEKLNDKPSPFGVPGVETTLPLLLNAVNEGRITLDRVIEMTSTNPKKLFNLKEDKTTYTEVDMDEEWVIKNEDVVSKSGWTQFDGWKVKGRVKKVVLRGKVVFENGKIKGPFGKIIYP